MFDRSKETKLLDNQSFVYHKQVVAILTMTKQHLSTKEISHIMRFTQRHFITLFNQNARLPKPYDWEEVMSMPEPERSYQFYLNATDKARLKEYEQSDEEIEKQESESSELFGNLLNDEDFDDEDDEENDD